MTKRRLQSSLESEKAVSKAGSKSLPPKKKQRTEIEERQEVIKTKAKLNKSSNTSKAEIPDRINPQTQGDNNKIIVPIKSKELFRLGNEYYSVGKTEEAMKLHQEAMELITEATEWEPKNAKYFNALGSTLGHFANGFEACEEAIILLTKATKLEPKNAKYFYDLGFVSFSNITPPEDAIEPFSKAAELEPKNAKYFHDWGIAEFKTYGGDDAIKPLTKATELEPKNAEYLYDLGVAYIDIYEHQKAITPLTKATKFEPENAKYFYDLGAAYIKLHQHEAAIEPLTKAVELEPYQMLFSVWLSRVHYCLGQYENAVAVASKFLDRTLISSEALFAQLAKEEPWEPNLKNHSMAKKLEIITKYKVPLNKAFIRKKVEVDKAKMNVVDAFVDYTNCTEFGKQKMLGEALKLCLTINTGYVMHKVEFLVRHPYFQGKEKELAYIFYQAAEEDILNTRYDKALQLYDRAIALNPGFLDAYVQASTISAELKREALADKYHHGASHLFQLYTDALIDAVPIIGELNAITQDYLFAPLVTETSGAIDTMLNGVVA